MTSSTSVGIPSHHTPCTFVFIHGLFGQKSDWDDVRTALSFLPSISISLPGHEEEPSLPEEEADAWSAVAFLYKEKLASIKNPLLVGYSMGGRLAMALMSTYPERFKYGILISAHPGIPCVEDRVLRLSTDMILSSKVARGLTTEFFKTWYNQPIFSSLFNNPSLLSTLCAPRPFHDPLAVADTVKRLSLGSQPFFLKLLRSQLLPPLFIVGENDQKYRMLLTEFSSYLPNSRIVIVPSAGHMVHREAPDLIAQAIVEYKRSVINSGSDK